MFFRGAPNAVTGLMVEWREPATRQETVDMCACVKEKEFTDSIGAIEGSTEGEGC